MKKSYQILYNLPKFVNIYYVLFLLSHLVCSSSHFNGASKIGVYQSKKLYYRMQSFFIAQ